MKYNKTITIGIAGMLAAGMVWGLSSCVAIPKGAQAVRPFDQMKYLGTWYEIARMDFKFERNLENVTAIYSMINENTIRVDNKGYDTKAKKWKESIGKAKPAAGKDEGRLKVSFFGPCYAGYGSSLPL